MDHIVPRKGTGSTNTRENLAAVCQSCNQSKSNKLFRTWAEGNPRQGAVSLKEALDRVDSFNEDDFLTGKRLEHFKKEVKARLQRTGADEPIDNRSIESVAWMANELRARIEAHFKARGSEVQVRVFRGAITAEARKASGFEGRVKMIGGNGKTRLDRRHHAMDASVIALMSDYVAQTLAERISLRESEFLEPTGTKKWKDHPDLDAPHRVKYEQWLRHMRTLVEIFNQALSDDAIPVTQAVRLRLGNSAAHDATIKSFSTKMLGEAWTRDEIDRASSKQMWIALSRDPGFSDETGLPVNPNRELRVKNRWFSADENVNILPKKIAAIPVRGGFAGVGGTIHHVRLYKIPGKTKPKYGMVRVFAPDLLPFRHQDLFSAPLGPESISMRDAKSAVRDAILTGNTEYLGWLVAGTELELDLSDPYFQKNKIGGLLADFPQTNRWMVKGFEDNSRISLRPTQLSSEGLDRVDHSEDSENIIGASAKDKGWRADLNQLLQHAAIRCIYRNVLGEERTSTANGLPVSRTIKD